MSGETICERPVAEYEDFVRQNYIRNIQMFSRDDLPYTVELWSDEFFAAWDKNHQTQDILGREIVLGGAISFAYIDGNHSYEYSQRDFLNCHRHLLPGGFILFDDSRDFGPHECRKVAQEAARRPDYEVIIKNPNYLLRKIK